MYRDRRTLLLAGSCLAAVLLAAAALAVGRAALPQRPSLKERADFLDEMGEVVASHAAEMEAVRHADLPEEEKERRWRDIRGRRRAAVGALYRGHGRTPPPGH